MDTNIADKALAQLVAAKGDWREVVRHASNEERRLLESHDYAMLRGDEATAQQLWHEICDWRRVAKYVRP